LTVSGRGARSRACATLTLSISSVTRPRGSQDPRAPWSRVAKSSGLPAATGRAVGLISGRVRLQAYTLTFIDGFHLVAWACVAALLLIALLRKAPLNYRELGFQDEETSATQGTKS